MTSQADCSSACVGDNTELCGAGSRLSVWSLNKFASNAQGLPGAASTATASAVPAATSIAALGCYNEVGSPRTLSTFYVSGSSISIDQCAQQAQALNLKYFGLEYASQCLAGSVLSPASLPIASNKCNMMCAGNSSQVCGGSNAISLYNNTAWIKPYNPNLVNVPNQPGTQFGYVGCYTEGTGARALGSTQNSGSANTPASTTLTVEACAAFCFSKGLPWMGVENGNLCFCNAVGPINSAVLAPEGESGCNIPCVGNPTENCGAASRLNVYQLKSGSSSARVATPTTSSKSNSTAKKRGLYKVW
jgi:hypothetical protein